MVTLCQFVLIMICIIRNTLSYREGEVITNVSPPFGVVAQQSYDNPEIKKLLSDPDNYNPNWGKTGISFSIIYYIRNARLAIQYVDFGQAPQGKIDGMDYAEIWQLVFIWEMDIFTAFRAWYDNQNNDTWKEFVRVVYDIFNTKLKDFLANFSDFARFPSLMPIYKENGLGPKWTRWDDDENSVIIPNDVEFNKINPFIPSLKNGFPLIGFGSWPLKGQECKDAVLKALKTGYRMIDTSENYNNEKVIGEAIIESGIDRKEILIASKLSYNKNYGSGVTTDAFYQTLDNLGVEYIDIYMLHGAISDKQRLKEAWQELEQLYNDEKIRYLGVSNFGPSDMDQLMEYATIKPLFIQNKYDPFTVGQQTPWTPPIEDWVINYNGNNKDDDQTMIVQGYCALNSWPHQVSAVNDEHIKWIANKYNKTPAQLLIRWVLQHRYMGILTRSSKEERQIKNLDIFDFEIDKVDMQLLNSLNTLFSPFDIQWMNDAYGQVVNRPGPKQEL